MQCNHIHKYMGWLGVVKYGEEHRWEVSYTIAKTERLMHV